MWTTTDLLAKDGCRVDFLITGHPRDWASIGRIMESLQNSGVQHFAVHWQAESDDSMSDGSGAPIGIDAVTPSENIASPSPLSHASAQEIVARTASRPKAERLFGIGSNRKAEDLSSGAMRVREMLKDNGPDSWPGLARHLDVLSKDRTGPVVVKKRRATKPSSK